MMRALPPDHYGTSLALRIPHAHRWSPLEPAACMRPCVVILCGEKRQGRLSKSKGMLVDVGG